MFGTLGPLGATLIGIVLVALYLLPSLIAFNRGVQHRWLILLGNLVLGGTLIGWLVALYFATRKTPESHGDGLSRTA
ncbi:MULTISPECIES: superinfection immunity protein [unclassified Streptomyces]|uniref:superinfection immunity protein n=1 Tax=unclassified Streptomyces TaxID=2593676 RepID=UPI00324E7F33